MEWPDWARHPGAGPNQDPLALPATAAPARARQRLATSAAPAGQEGADAFAVDLELDLQGPLRSGGGGGQEPAGAPHMDVRRFPRGQRSEEHTSELKALMRSSYAVCCV